MFPGTAIVNENHHHHEFGNHQFHDIENNPASGDVASQIGTNTPVPPWHKLMNYMGNLEKQVQVMGQEMIQLRESLRMRGGRKNSGTGSDDKNDNMSLGTYESDRTKTGDGYMDEEEDDDDSSEEEHEKTDHYAAFQAQYNRSKALVPHYLHAPYMPSQEMIDKATTITVSRKGHETITVDADILTLAFYDAGETPLQKRIQWLYFVFMDETHSQWAMSMLIFILSLIAISTLAYILETVSQIEDWYGWVVIEIVVSISFTIEYVARFLLVRNRIFFWPSTIKKLTTEKWLSSFKLKPGCKAYLGWVFGIMEIIDLLAIAPFYLELAFPTMNVSTVRVIRVIRLARLARLRNLFADKAEIMGNALGNSMKESGALIMMMVGLEVSLFSSLVYAVENGVNPDGFFSIPDAMWWCIVTITTVGYGDFAPVTILGRVIASLCLLTGVIIFAIVVIIIGNDFTNAYKTYQDEKKNFEDKMVREEKRMRRDEKLKALGNGKNIESGSTEMVSTKRVYTGDAGETVENEQLV